MLHFLFANERGQSRLHSLLPTHSHDDSIVSYGNYSSNNYRNCCQICSGREIQRIIPNSNICSDFSAIEKTKEFQKKGSNCLKFEFRSRHSSGNEVTHICDSWIKYFRKHKMTRTIVKCLVLIVIVSCIGVYGYRTSSMTSSVSSSNNDVKIGGPNTIYMKDLLKTVKPEVLRKKMKKMTSYHDFIRIFMKNENMSDDEIDDFLQRRTFSDIDVINPVEKKEVMEDDYEPYIQSPDEMAVKAVDHINEVMASPLAECRVPKPELVYIPPEGDKMFAPEYTILHRCRNTTGCCWNRSQTCGVKAIQVVEKFFFSLRSTESQDTQLANDNVVVSKLLLNHTECECKDVNPLPGCDQRCPHPFRKERRTDYCTCECLHDHLPCLKVKYGIESLDPEEFQCVKDDQCMKPQCAEGEFDMRKGYCPGTATLPYQLLFRNKRNAER